MTHIPTRVNAKADFRDEWANPLADEEAGTLLRVYRSRYKVEIEVNVDHVACDRATDPGREREATEIAAVIRELSRIIQRLALGGLDLFTDGGG